MGNFNPQAIAQHRITIPTSLINKHFNAKHEDIVKGLPYPNSQTDEDKAALADKTMKTVMSDLLYKAASTVPDDLYSAMSRWEIRSFLNAFINKCENAAAAFNELVLPDKCKDPKRSGYLLDISIMAYETDESGDAYCLVPMVRLTRYFLENDGLINTTPVYDVIASEATNIEGVSPNEVCVTIKQECCPFRSLEVEYKESEYKLNVERFER